MTVDRTRGYRAFQAVNAVVLTTVVVVTLYPFINIVARSFSEEAFIRSGQVNLVPRGFNLTTYGIVTTVNFSTSRRDGSAHSGPGTATTFPGVGGSVTTPLSAITSVSSIGGWSTGADDGAAQPARTVIQGHLRWPGTPSEIAVRHPRPSEL